MYVCICNALTDTDIKGALNEGASKPAEVFAHCRCRAQCGTCVRSVCTMLGLGRGTASMHEAAAAA